MHILTEGPFPLPPPELYIEFDICEVELTAVEVALVVRILLDPRA
jgi:hypothetical protein